jgi:16S rRNA processing protein RimM
MGLPSYGALTAPDGRSFEIEAIRPAAGTSPDMMVVRFKGVSDRNAAERLAGIELSVPAEQLPPPDADEFYHADLIGLSAVTVDGQVLGTIVAVTNYGAGDLIEIAPTRGSTILIPFTRSAIPEIDVAAGRVVVVPPETEGSKRAIVHYDRKSSHGGLSLVELRPQTGRKHQLRVQLSRRGHPVVGDFKYGSETPFSTGIALHARRLTFLHPTRHEPVTVTAELPRSWRGRFAHLLREVPT